MTILVAILLTALVSGVLFITIYYFNVMKAKTELKQLAIQGAQTTIKFLDVMADTMKQKQVNKTEREKIV